MEWLLEEQKRVETADWQAAGVEILGPPKEPRILNEHLTQAWLAGGTRGETAKVTIAVTTSEGRILERFFELDVL